MPDESPQSKTSRFRILGVGSLLLAAGIGIGIYLAKDRGNGFPGAGPTAAEIETIRGIPKPTANVVEGGQEIEPINETRDALFGLNRAERTIKDDIAILDHLFNQSITVFKHLPTGTHDEIVRFYQGKNPRGIVYIPKESTNLDKHSRIIDRWGTPFVFHPLSSRQMEVRSAGPDAIPWTDDDIISDFDDRPQETPPLALSE